MNKTATVRARIDPETKRKAEAILKRLGLTHSALITMTYRAVAETGGIPFSLHVPNAETRAAMEELETGKGREAKGKNAKDVLAHILEDESKT